MNYQSTGFQSIITIIIDTIKQYKGDTENAEDYYDDSGNCFGLFL